MCECLQNGLVGRLAICRQLPAALPPSPPPASDGSVDTCHCIESITISHGDAKCDLDMTGDKKQKQKTRSEKRRQYADHGQQTQQTMARRRRAVAAPTVTPMATVSLVEKAIRSSLVQSSLDIFQIHSSGPSSDKSDSNI